MCRKRLEFGVAALVALTLLLAAAFWFDLWPGLRGGYGWRWPYAAPEPGRLLRITPAIAVLAAYGAGLYLLWRAQGPAYVAWCVAGATILPLALLCYLGDPIQILLGRTITEGTTGAFSVAAKMGAPLAALRDWPAWMVRAEDISSHMAISPPGYPLLYGLAAQALGALPGLARALAAPIRAWQCHHVALMALDDHLLATAWLGIVSPLWGALAVIPLYRLAQREGNESPARWVCALWALVPSLGIFTGLLTTPYPLFAVSCCALLGRGVATRNPIWALLAGVTLALGVLFSLALLPLGLTLALWALLEVRRKYADVRVRLSNLALLAGAGLLGAGGVAGLYTLIAQHSPWEVFASSLAFHLGHIERPYWPWVVLHSWDYLLFFGPVLTGLSLWGLRHSRHGAGRLSLAAWLTLLVLVISGTGRGETGRIWLFFMPMTLLGAAAVLQRLSHRAALALGLAHSFWLLALVVVLRPVGITTTPPPRYTMALADMSSPLQTVEVAFGPGTWLTGYHVTQEGDQLQLTLRWKTGAPIREAWHFSALLVSPEGPLAAATDWRPLGGEFPTTCWHRAPGGIVQDQVTLPLGQNPPSGAWWISLAAYTLDAKQTPHRVPACPAGSPCDDQVGLGPIIVVQSRE
jgi:hypothetical protein